MSNTQGINAMNLTLTFCMFHNFTFDYLLLLESLLIKINATINKLEKAETFMAYIFPVDFKRT